MTLPEIAVKHARLIARQTLGKFLYARRIFDVYIHLYTFDILKKVKHG